MAHPAYILHTYLHSGKCEKGLEPNAIKYSRCYVPRENGIPKCRNQMRCDGSAPGVPQHTEPANIN